MQTNRTGQLGASMEHDGPLKAWLGGHRVRFLEVISPLLPSFRRSFKSGGADTSPEGCWFTATKSVHKLRAVAVSAISCTVPHTTMGTHNPTANEKQHPQQQTRTTGQKKQNTTAPWSGLGHPGTSPPTSGAAATASSPHPPRTPSSPRHLHPYRRRAIVPTVSVAVRQRHCRVCQEKKRNYRKKNVCSS